MLGVSQGLGVATLRCDRERGDMRPRGWPEWKAGRKRRGIWIDMGRWSGDAAGVITTTERHGVSLGRGKLGYPSGRAHGNVRRGYAGAEMAAELVTGAPGTYHMRHRVYQADEGRWTRRDPIGYVNGMNLHEYAMSNPIHHTGPIGLDVFIETTDAVYPSLHQRVCVDTWNEDCTKKTGKFCISFGHDGPDGSKGSSGTTTDSCEDGGSSDSDKLDPEGEDEGDERELPPNTSFPIDGPDPDGDGIVHEDNTDPSTGRTTTRKQNGQQDKEVHQYFKRLVGVRTNYSIVTQDCRHFSENALIYARIYAY